MNDRQERALILIRDPGLRRRVLARLRAERVSCVAAGAWEEIEPGQNLQDIRVVVLQICLSDLEGVTGALTRIRSCLPNSALIVITPGGSTAFTRSAFLAGARDCLAEPINHAELCRCIIEALRNVPALSADATADPARTAGELDAGREGQLKKTLGELSLEEMSDWMERIRSQLRRACIEATRALVKAVEVKDPFTQAHSRTVSAYAENLGRRLRMEPRMIETLRTASLLHDVGKIGVPDAILAKPGPLTSQEFDIVKRHPQTAIEILRHVSYLSDERPLILHHHERYDGNGYPAGLSGEQIPFGARVLGVADAMDAMFSPRSYKSAFDVHRVRHELREGAGKQFDPRIAEAAVRWLDEEPTMVQANKEAVNQSPSL